LGGGWGVGLGGGGVVGGGGGVGGCDQVCDMIFEGVYLSLPPIKEQILVPKIECVCMCLCGHGLVGTFRCVK